MRLWRDELKLLLGRVFLISSNRGGGNVDFFSLVMKLISELCISCLMGKVLVILCSKSVGVR